MKTLQHLINVGSHYFPEQMWKIYLVNTPLIFRGIWLVLKPFLHPITIAKVDNQTPHPTMPSRLGELLGIVFNELCAMPLASSPAPRTARNLVSDE